MEEYLTTAVLRKIKFSKIYKGNNRFKLNKRGKDLREEIKQLEKLYKK